MTQEALKLALDFIEDVNFGEWRGSTERQEKAITAIKEALAKEKTLQALHHENERLGLYKDAYAQPEQEPVAWTLLLTGEHNGLIGKAGEKFIGAPDYYQRVNVYTTPPQRTWVGLTNNELQTIADEYRILFGSWVEDFARAIEAKLKDRNDHSI